MKTTFFLLFIAGTAPFALANTELLPSNVDFDVLELSVVGSLHGSLGLIGALCFGLVVAFRLKRSGR